MRDQRRNNSEGRTDRTPVWIGAIVAVAAAVTVVTYSQVRFAEDLPISIPNGGVLRAAAPDDPMRHLGPEEMRRLSDTAPAAGPSRQTDAAEDPRSR